VFRWSPPVALRGIRRVPLGDVSDKNYGENRFYRHVASHWIEIQQALIAIIIAGVFEFHPKLRVGFLEAQNSWVPGILSRIRMGLFAIPRLPCTVPDAHAEGILPTQLLGGGRGEQAGDRSHGTANRCRSHVHFDELPPFRFQLSECVDQSAQRCPGDVAADIFLGGAGLYGFTETEFARAEIAARRTLAAVASGS